MSNEPDIDPGGQRVEGDEAHECYSEPVDPSSSGEAVVNPTFSQYMVTDDNEWVQPLPHVVYDDVYQFQDLHNVGQHLDHTEEVYLLTDAESDMEARNSVESLQVAANEVVIDDMLRNTVEPQHYVAAVPEEVVPAYPQQQLRSNSNHFGQTGRPRHIETIPGSNRVHYIVQNPPSTLEMQPNHSVQYEVRPAAMFEGPSNQPIGEPPPHHVPVLRSRSKSQPRRPLYGELEDESLAYLVQEYDEGEWDGVEIEDHEYFIGGPDEREAIILAEDRQEQSNLRPPKTIQRPYFPPNLSPTEKKEYLLVNYKKACDRYFPFANVALLEADTRYKPVEAFASDLYRFHSRGAHIHGFFRTVIDTRDRPSHDQTRYIQDIQFGKVFPLFPDYEEWDDNMRSEFRQLSNRLMQIFERKCFYANTGSGHGRAPIIRRGPRPTQKPPPDYAEQQRIQYKGIPRGFQSLRSSIATQMKMFSTKPTSSHSPFTTLPGSSTTTLKPLAGDASTSEPIVVPHELGTPRLEAYEHNKRVSIKRLVNNAFVNREQVSLQCEEPVRQTSVSQSLTCRVPDGPSKTLRHQRSTASKAIRMIANRTIEPVIDLATGRYVVSLDELRGLDHASTERQRYVQRPLHTLREMADSARRGGGSYNWTPGGRPQGARVSRIDQAPRFTHNSTVAASSTSHQNLPFSYGAIRAPLLTNVSATEVARKPGVLTGNALTTATSSLIRSDHVYPRSHSSGRREAPASNYRRSASSGRPVTRTLGTNSVPALSDIGCTSEQILDDLPTECMPTSAPVTEITDENQGSIQQVEKCSASLTNKSHSQLSDQNNSSRNAQRRLASRVTSSQKPQKEIVLLRDEHGQLRRVKRLPDGTLLIRDRPPGNLISQLGRIPTETRSSAEVRRSGSPKAGTVWDVQSIVGKQGKKIGREVDQWRRSQAFLASWNHSASISGYEGALHNHNSRNSASITQPKVKSKRKDVLYPDDDNEIIVITGKKREKHVKNVAKPQKHSRKSVLFDHVSTVASRKSRQRIPKLVSRLTVVNRTPVPEEQGFTHRKRVEPHDHDDDNTAIDIETVDDTVEEAIKELIASAPPSGFPDAKEQCLQARKKAGRPPKKFRGRLAKQKQAIRDAEIAEKVAIKQRELPVLDLTLKVIEDPTVELPLEATILLDSSIIHDTALLHEVGEVLKELVAQVCLEELQPKRDIKSRSRRCWEHLPERVRSKRQEYRNLNVPVAQRSPPPPPLRSKPRGRNSEKYRQAVLERAKQQSGEGAAPNIRNQSKPLNTSQEEVAEIQIGGGENIAHCSNHDQSPSLCSKSQSGMRNAWEEDFAFSGLEDFDLNEDDLVDINVDTFFKSAENIDPSSGDEGDTPSHKMRQKLRTFLGEVVHFPRVTPTRVDSNDPKKTTEASSTEASKSLGIKQEHIQEDQAEDDVGQVATHVVDIIIDQISSWICHSLEYDDKRTEQKTCEDQFTHFKESNSLVSVVLSLKKGESSGTALQKIMDTDITSSFHDDYGNCYRHIRLSTSVIPELKTSSLHNFGVDVLDFPFDMSAVADLSVKDVDVRLDNISSEYPVPNAYLTSDEVAHIQIAEHHSSKEDLVFPDIEYSSCCDIVFFEAVGEEERYSVSGAVNIAAVGVECLNIVCDVSINLSRTEFTCNHVEERCFDVQKNFAGFTYSNQQCIHSIHTMDTNFSGNDEHLQVCFSLLCANAEVDQLSIIMSDLSLIHLTPDATGNIMFESLVGTDEEFEGISVSTTGTIIVPFEEYCSFSNISTSNVIKDGRLTESILISHNVPCAEQERNALSVIRIDCSFVNIDEEEEMAELAFLTKSHLLQICGTITPVKLKVTNDGFFAIIEGIHANSDLQTEQELLRRRKWEDGGEQPVIGTGNEVMAESFSCGIPLGTTISGELEESCIPSFLGREDTREGPVSAGNLVDSADSFGSSSGTAARPRAKRRTVSRRRRSQVALINSAIVESSLISKYLQSDDPPDSGFSPITYLEQCFIQSPDLFGIKADMSRKKPRMKHSASTSDQITGPITRSRAKRLSAEREKSIVKFTANDTSTALDHLWRRTHYTAGESLIGTVAIICKAFKAAELSPRPFLQSAKAIKSCRRGSHLISDFNLATIKSSNPIVTLEPDMSKLDTSIRPVTPFRLSLPRCEGSLESALMQYEAGVKCILEQVKSTRSVVENIRSTSHWTLHFLMDAQLYMLDIQYEIWEYLTRCVQLGVFSIYQCSLWETHHQLFDARMHCLLFEMNAAVALASQAEMCSSYVRRFEEWNRKTNNFSSIYNNAHGLALSLIKHITIPNALTRLQSMTRWNSKERPYKSSEEVFFIDLVPFFEIGTCPFANTDFDMEKFFLDTQSIECDSLENLISDNVTQNNSANGFSFLFPSFAVLSICRNQIYKEVSSYFNNHIDELMRNDHYHLSLISPMSRAYVLSRFHETRAKFLMRNNIMNLNKIIAKLNSTFDELKGIVDKTGQVELDCPCGQVVFFFDSGKVGVNINSLSTENVHVPDPVLAEEGRRIMGDCVKNTVFDPLTIVEQEKENSLTMKHDRMKKSIEIVKDWVMTVSSTYDDEVHCGTTDAGVECVEPVEVMCPSSPAHVTVIEDVDDESGSLASVVSKQTKKKCCNIDTVTTTIAGRRIEYSVNCADGVLKMKTMDSLTDDTSTDNLSATNTITTASFSSFDQIETLKIIRSHETGEFNWIAMIKNALDGIPAPKIAPAFLRGSGSSDCQIDVMKTHERANHFIQELDKSGEFIDQRKEQRERIRQFQHVDYFERKRNARFEAISSETSLEFTMPKADERDKVPLYALWISEVVRYADIERKRMMQLRPINNVGRCRAARSEMIREFAIPCKRARRCNSTPPWFGRTVYEHYGDDLSLGMARLEYEISGRKMQPDPQIGSHDDAITHYFISRNNSPSTMVDPLELLENPYSFFQHKPVAGKRILPPLVESSLVKKVCLSDPPIFAPFTSLKNEPETLYPPCDSDFDSSDDEL